MTKSVVIINWCECENECCACVPMCVLCVCPVMDSGSSTLWHWLFIKQVKKMDGWWRECEARSEASANQSIDWVKLWGRSCRSVYIDCTTDRKDFLCFICVFRRHLIHWSSWERSKITCGLTTASSILTAPSEQNSYNNLGQGLSVCLNTSRLIRDF